MSGLAQAAALYGAAALGAALGFLTAALLRGRKRDEPDHD